MNKEVRISLVILFFLSLFLARNFFYFHNDILVEWSIFMRRAVPAYKYFDYNIKYLSFAFLSYLLVREYWQKKGFLYLAGLFFLLFFIINIIVIFIHYDFINLTCIVSVSVISMLAIDKFRE